MAQALRKSSRHSRALSAKLFRVRIAKKGIGAPRCFGAKMRSHQSRIGNIADLRGSTAHLAMTSADRVAE